MKNIVTYLDQLVLLILLLPIALPGQDNCNALHFDGIDDYVQANSPFSGNTDFTVEAWFLSENDFTDDCDGSRDVGDFRWLLGWDDNQFGMGVCGDFLRFWYRPICPVGAGICTSLRTVDVGDGRWHHVAVTKTNAIRIYVDGVFMTNFSGPAYDMSGFFRIGSSGSGRSGRTWKGSIDEVRIWDRALTEEEINNQSNCGLIGDENGLVAYYPMNEGQAEQSNANATTLTDEGPNNNDGVLNNFSLMTNTSNWVTGQPGLCVICTDEEPCEDDIFEDCPDLFMQLDPSITDPGLYYLFEVAPEMATNFPEVQWSYGANTPTVLSRSTEPFSIEFPSAANYEVCWTGFKEDGCIYQCCKTICVDDPFNCEDEIAVEYDDENQSFQLELANPNNQVIISWINESTGKNYGSEPLVSIPNLALDSCAVISVQYFDEAAQCYRICQREICNESCADLRLGRLGRNDTIYNQELWVDLHTMHTVSHVEVEIISPALVSFTDCQSIFTQEVTGIDPLRFGISLQGCNGPLIAGTEVEIRLTLLDVRAGDFWCCHLPEATLTIPPFNLPGIPNAPSTNISPPFYPNPAARLLTIQWHHDQIGTIDELRVMDTKGRLLQQFREEDGQTVDITNLKPGLYLLQSIQQNKLLSINKLIKL